MPWTTFEELTFRGGLSYRIWMQASFENIEVRTGCVVRKDCSLSNFNHMLLYNFSCLVKKNQVCVGNSKQCSFKSYFSPLFSSICIHGGRV